jgi:hypothetical protein
MLARLRLGTSMLANDVCLTDDSDFLKAVGLRVASD